VVTGAASGIGLALARQLAAGGARVVMADIAEAPLRAAAMAIGEAATAIPCDVGDPASVDRLAAESLDKLGGIDIAFANAGVTANGPLIKGTAAEFDWIYSVNVRGAWATIAAFARIMADQETGGRICVTASEHSLGLQHAGAGFYTASKHAVLGLAEVFRAELPPKVIMSTFCPGLVATNLADPPRPAGVPHPRADRLAFSRQVQSQGMDPEDAARAALRGVERGDFYIVTHPSAYAAARLRFEEIDAAFAAQAPADGDTDRYDVNRIVADMLAKRRAD
jgi:NAD(P)-dependent dehydrogenase (short-subunit alcohol dehydrogenase family)